MTVGGDRERALGDLFYQPSVLVHASPDMKISGDEIFGPVAPITRSFITSDSGRCFGWEGDGYLL